MKLTNKYVIFILVLSVGILIGLALAKLEPTTGGKLLSKEIPTNGSIDSKDTKQSNRDRTRYERDAADHGELDSTENNNRFRNIISILTKSGNLQPGLRFSDNFDCGIYVQDLFELTDADMIQMNAVCATARQRLKDWEKNNSKIIVSEQDRLVWEIDSANSKIEEFKNDFLQDVAGIVGMDGLEMFDSNITDIYRDLESKRIVSISLKEVDNNPGVVEYSTSITNYDKNGFSTGEYTSNDFIKKERLESGNVVIPGRYDHLFEME